MANSTRAERRARPEHAQSVELEYQTPKPTKARELRQPSRSRQGGKRGGSRSFSEERIKSVIEDAEKLGLLGSKSARISGRVSPRLVAEAKRQTGLESDTEIIEFALANLAVEDNFAEVLKRVNATVDPMLDLEF